MSYRNLLAKLKRPRPPKTVAALLLAGFLAFAPPGTLIACAALALALFGYCTGSGDKKDAAPETRQAVETQEEQPQQPPRPSPSLTPTASPATPTPSPTPAPPR